MPVLRTIWHAATQIIVIAMGASLGREVAPREARCRGVRMDQRQTRPRCGRPSNPGRLWSRCWPGRRVRHPVVRDHVRSRGSAGDLLGAFSGVGACRLRYRGLRLLRVVPASGGLLQVAGAGTLAWPWSVWALVCGPLIGTRRGRLRCRRQTHREEPPDLGQPALVPSSGAHAWWGRSPSGCRGCWAMGTVPLRRPSTR